MAEQSTDRRAELLAAFWRAGKDEDTEGRHRMGEFGEKCMRAVALEAGYHYIPLGELTRRGAPMSEAKSEKVILTDGMIAGRTLGDDKPIGMVTDAKAKTGPVYWRQGRELRQGINEVNWLAYLRCGEIYQKLAGIMVFEFFTVCRSDWERKPRETTLPPWSGRILLGPFARLGNEPAYGINSQKHMVYWRDDQFIELDRLTPEAMLSLSRGRAKNYLVGINQAFDVKRQKELYT